MSFQPEELFLFPISQNDWPQSLENKPSESFVALDKMSQGLASFCVQKNVTPFPATFYRNAWAKNRWLYVFDLQATKNDCDLEKLPYEFAKFVALKGHESLIKKYFPKLNVFFISPEEVMSEQKNS